MKAALINRYGSNDAVIVADTALPAMGATDVLVRVHAASVNPVDIKTRRYGVARWFYPSDAAAALDWNRFAVEGVRRVRGARTPVELETALEEPFIPPGRASRSVRRFRRCVRPAVATLH